MPLASGLHAWPEQRRGIFTLSTVTRPLREDERRSLSGLAGYHTLLSVGLMPTLFFFIITFAIGIWIERALGVYRYTGVVLPALAAAGVAGYFAIYLYRKSAPFLEKVRGAYSRDLALGTVTCTTYDVVDALRVEELEDEGSGYYLKLADGGVLFLQGQYLYEYEEVGADGEDEAEPARFPASRFTIERAPESGLVMGLRDLGALIPVSGTLKPFTLDDHENSLVPEDGAILHIDFESLRARRTGPR